jgi:hypothetical protein
MAPDHYGVTLNNKPIFEVVNVTKTNGQKVSGTEYALNCDAKIKLLIDYDRLKDQALKDIKASHPLAWANEINIILGGFMGEVTDKTGGTWVKAGESRIIKWHLILPKLKKAGS